MSTNRVVIVGAGLAAAHVASTIREAGDSRPVTIVGDEGRRPYERPGLSKGVLQGEQQVDELFVHDAGWYEDNSVDVRFDDAAAGLEVAAQRVRLASGEVKYGDLVLATGARPRTVDLPGVDLDGVHMLRRIEDCEALREAFGGGGRLVVIGAGWIGLEVAAAGRKAGLDVTVLEYAQVPLRTALGDRMGGFFARLHERNGVDLRTGIGVTAIEGDGGRVTGVRAGGEVFPADVVVVGVGAVPNVELAQAAGLEVDNGVLVDDRLRAAEHIYAIGDVASAVNPTLGVRLRVEHWDNAIRQGRLAGSVLLGEDARYDWQPYFFTDQYDLGMEYVGRGSADDDVVLRGDEESGAFIAFWLRDGVVSAAMNVNTWDVNETLRALVGRRIEPSRLVDPGIDLDDL